MPKQNKLWFKSWPAAVPKSLDYPEVPLQKLLRDSAKKYHNAPAITYSNREITYAELDLFSDKFAATLAALGVKKDSKIAVFLPNIPQFIIAYFGILKTGAVLTAISPLHKDREVANQLNNSHAEVIVTLNTLYPIVERVWRKTKLKNAVVTKQEEIVFKTIDASKLHSPNASLFQELMKHPAKPPIIEINAQEDLAALQYTGGTTGTAKGAMLTHLNLISNAIAFATWIEATSADTFLTALPLFHIYGMTTSMTVPISVGAKMVLLPSFDPVEALATIQRERVTVFCGVPTMYSILLTNPELGKFDLTSIRVCISGASPLPPQVQKKFMQITGGFLAEGYGLTEASPVTHCNPVDETMRTVRVGSIGLPISDTNARIVDVKTGRKTLESGKIGELAVKGPQVMKGYWNNPKETTLVLRDGWLLTGDIGRMDSDGYFYITDRKKDLIKYKDYSVYPREVEDILYEHPAVKICAVVGKPTPLVGEIPKAFIVLKDGTKASQTEIIAYVKEKVASYKAVREVEFRQTLPISAAGKVLKRKLQEEEKRKP